MKLLPKTCWRWAFLVLASSSCEGNDNYSKHVLAASCVINIHMPASLSRRLSRPPLANVVSIFFQCQCCLFFTAAAEGGV